MSIVDIFLKKEPEKPQEAPKPESSATRQSGGVNYAAPPKVEDMPPKNAGAGAALDASGPTAETNDEIVKTLWQTIIDKNLPGPDYLEVKSNAAALESMGLPEDKRYEAAFKMLKASNPDFTKEKLLASIDTYFGIVDGEMVAGRQECEDKRKATVGDREQKIAELRKKSEDVDRKIAELGEEKRKSENEASRLEDEVRSARAELDREAAVFENSVKSVKADLARDKDVMSKLNI